MVMNKPFTTTSQILSNYDYLDVANGTGVQIFYGIPENASTGLNFFLSPVNDYGTTEILYSSDFDLDLTPFTTPRTATGTAILKAANQLAASTFKAQLRKWDGTTETNISSQIGTFSGGAEELQIIRIPITETLFLEGDVLRLNINGRLIVDATTPIKLQIPFKLDL